MEHSDIINKIVEAEKTAKHVAEEARKQRETLNDDLKKEREDMRKNYFDRADRRIAAVKEKEQAYADEMIASLEAGLQADMASDDAAVAANRD
ncbi:hypothetical protein LJC32_06595, partial [Oscillospiraceae bacterium OttesenSCG-928-F05]|nr:hypothetical protein [Oscillospiraceae bacterium OttesenSCG-928-F05]